MSVIDLDFLLIKPVQRVVKYPLLLRELAKASKKLQPDENECWFRDLEKATELSQEVAQNINEGKRGIDIGNFLLALL